METSTMKAVLLLLTVLIVTNFRASAEIITLREGVTIDAVISKFNKNEFTILQKGAADAEKINRSQVQSINFSQQSAVNDLFCFQQKPVIKNLNKSTILRDIRIINMESPYLWNIERVLTIYNHETTPTPLLSFSLLYEEDFEKVEFTSANIITQENQVNAVSDFVNESSLYQLFPKLSSLKQTHVKLLNLPPKSILNLKMRFKRKYKDQFSNFYERYRLSSLLPTLKFEVTVNHPEKPEWNLDSKSNVPDQIRYLRSNEQEKVSKVWWIENVPANAQEQPTLTISATDLSKPEIIELCRNFVNDKIKDINKQIIRSQQQLSLKKAINNFQSRFIVLPSVQIPFATNPLIAYRKKCGNAVTLSTLLTAELEARGYKTTLILAKPAAKVTDFFNFSSYNIPILKVQHSETRYFSLSPEVKKMHQLLTGFNVYGEAPMKESEISDDIQFIDCRKMIEVNFNITEKNVSLSTNLPLIAELDKQAFSQLSGQLFQPEGVRVKHQLKNGHLQFQATTAEPVTLNKQEEKLTVSMPRINSLFRLYPDFNAVILMHVTIPEQYRVSALPSEGSAGQRRFTPTANGFNVKIYSNVNFDPAKELIILKNESAKENRFWFE